MGRRSLPLRVRTLSAVLLVAALSGSALAANPPAAMRVQGSLISSAGTPVSGTFALKLSLYDAQSGGSAVHTQTFGTVPVTGGVFELDLSGLQTTSLDAAADLWLETQVVGEAPLPRQRLLSAPFALRANTALSAVTAAGLACSGCVDASDVAAGAITGAQIADGAIASADVGFPWAEGKTKGGAAANLDCTGCVGAADIAAGAVGTAQILDGAVGSADVGFNYAGSDSKGGDALGLTCTGCVTSGHLASGLTLEGDTSVTGSLLACTAGTPGCRVQLSNKGGLYDPGDGALNLQADGGVRVRNLANGAWAPVQTGAAAVNGAATVTGTLSVGTTSTVKTANIGGSLRLTHSTLGNVDLVLNNSPTASSLQVVPSGSTNIPDVTFYRGDGNPAVHIETSNGRVGVGTTAPAVTLDVAGDVRATGSPTSLAQLSTDGAIELTRATVPYIDLKDSVSDDYDVRLQQVDDGLRIRTGGQGSAAERVVVDAAGRLGVGTMAPEGTLDVNGTTHLRGTMDAHDNRVTGAYVPLGKHGAGSYNIVGYHYDAFIAADKKWTVTASAGANSGSVAEMFDGQSNSMLRYPQSAVPVTVTINMGIQHYWHAVGVYFPYGRSIKGIKVEKFYDPNDGNGWSCSDPAAAWAVVAQTTTFDGADWITTDNLGNGICQLRFTFTGTINITDEAAFRIGEIQAWREAHYGDEGLYLTRTGVGGSRLYSGLSVDGAINANGGVDFGAGASDDLTAADVATLTGGGNADALHTHASSSAPKGWKSVGDLNQIFSLVSTYPMTEYEYGVQYNTVLGGVHAIICSGWNRGYRCMTRDPYLIGDYTSQFAIGGAAWFYDTYDAWDDGCTNAGQWFHQYFALGSGSGWAAGITWIGGNGCSIPGLFVRAR